jgi:hypothetical protein
VPPTVRVFQLEQVACQQAECWLIWSLSVAEVTPGVKDEGCGVALVGPSAEREALCGLLAGPGQVDVNGGRRAAAGARRTGASWATTAVCIPQAAADDNVVTGNPGGPVQPPQDAVGQSGLPRWCAFRATHR